VQYEKEEDKHWHHNPKHTSTHHTPAMQILLLFAVTLNCTWTRWNDLWLFRENSISHDHHVCWGWLLLEAG
jgi:hypothetical protein